MRVGSDGIPGEKAAEVDELKHIGEVLPIDLKSHFHAIGLVNIATRRSVDLKRRIDAATDITDIALSLDTKRVDE